MRRWTFARSCSSFAVAAVLLAGSAPIRAGEVRLDGRTFVVAEGFEVERVAASPLVDRPIVGDFDEQGRLYVADSSGSNDPVVKQVVEKPHRIVRLEDTDGDGRFDKRTVFADRMMFPEGVMWLDGSLYVSAPPSIWKITDDDGDGVSDRRVEWFQGKTLTGCANDLHGPYRGPDGWIYWCKGAFAQQTYPRPGRSPLVTKAAHIFRARPDGSGIESVMTGGMDNPVDVVFTPGGERIFTTTFLQIPSGGFRDGLIHAVYGGVYGKVNDVLDGHPRTGPDLMPPLDHLGPAAPCGLTRYESDVFGPGYRDNLFASLFNMQKVTRHVLEPSGATFKTVDHDFLVSPDRDFHPTDVLADADGSLLVLDTGGWYKLCCPTSQLGKPDVLGAIYRVRRTGAPRVDDPRGTKLAWRSLTLIDLEALLDDPRPAVRQRAIAALAGRGDEAVPSLRRAARSCRSAEGRRGAVWASTRIEGTNARAVAREALGDRDDTVRQVAIHSSSVRLDRDAVPRLLEVLKGSSEPNRRAAAEALGRIGDKAVVPALLEAAGHPADRALEHSLTFALIEIADPKGTAIGLESSNPRTRRAALVALDQMEGGGLAPGAVAPLLAAADPALKDAAAWIVGRHPEWAVALVGVFRDRLDAKELAPAESTEVERQLARFAASAPVQTLLGDRLRDHAGPRDRRLIVLRAMAQSGLKVVPPAWIDGLARVLAEKDEDAVRQAVATSRALPIPRAKAAALVQALLSIADDVKTPADLRLAAFAAVPGGLETVSPPVLAFLREELGPDLPVASRQAAAEVLSRARLTNEQLGALTDSVKTAGPLEIDRLLTAFERSNDAEVGTRLIAALKQSPALGTLRPDTLRPRLAKFDAKVRPQAEALYESMNVDAAKQKAKLEGLLASLSGGDVRHGQAIFNGTKAACSACHAIGYLGGRVGPDLTRIGGIRTERDLLESIVFPSASFVRSFEPVVVATKEGKLYNGLPRKDAPDELILATGPNQEARIARDDIEEVRPGTVSVMPAGLDQQLSAKELADLVAFLRACR